MTMPKVQFRSIQYVRSIAALMVVFHHTRNAHPGLFNPLSRIEVGQAGVDLFFVISGFVMLVAAREERAGAFVVRRLIRIVPLYWIATLATVALFTGTHIERFTGTRIADLLLSLLLVPHHSLDNPGTLFPTLFVGWTLYYEFFFYVIFTLGLASRHLALLGCVRQCLQKGGHGSWSSGLA